MNGYTIPGIPEMTEAMFGAIAATSCLIEPREWCLSAAEHAAGTAAVLIEAARGDTPAGDLLTEEVIERLADALKLTLEVCTGHGDADDYAAAKAELHRHVTRFLEGWA